MVSDGDRIQFTIVGADESIESFNLKLSDVEALIPKLLAEISDRSPDRGNLPTDRTPALSAEYPSFMLNTTDMNEIVVGFSPGDWRPFTFTLTMRSAEALRDGLTAMLERLGERAPITKQ